MAKYVTNTDIVLATIRCAWKYGLSAVTIGTIGKEVGILGQGLYNHFSGKEEILATAFNYCDRQLSDLFEGVRLDPADDYETCVRKLWFRYLDYFVTHPAENSFYRQFRETVRFPHKAERSDSYFAAFWALVEELKQRFALPDLGDQDILLAYLRNVTPVYARMIEDGALPDSEQTREQMWRMMFRGLRGLTEE